MPTEYIFGQNQIQHKNEMIIQKPDSHLRFGMDLERTFKNNFNKNNQR